MTAPNSTKTRSAPATFKVLGFAVVQVGVKDYRFKVHSSFDTAAQHFKGGAKVGDSVMMQELRILGDGTIDSVWLGDVTAGAYGRNSFELHGYRAPLLV